MAVARHVQQCDTCVASHRATGGVRTCRLAPPVAVALDTWAWPIVGEGPDYHCGAWRPLARDADRPARTGPAAV